MGFQQVCFLSILFENSFCKGDQGSAMHYAAHKTMFARSFPLFWKQREYSTLMYLQYTRLRLGISPVVDKIVRKWYNIVVM
jgi:hypothetical protein